MSASAHPEAKRSKTDDDEALRQKLRHESYLNDYKMFMDLPGNERQAEFITKARLADEMMQPAFAVTRAKSVMGQAANGVWGDMEQKLRFANEAPPDMRAKALVDATEHRNALFKKAHADCMECLVKYTEVMKSFGEFASASNDLRFFERAASRDPTLAEDIRNEMARDVARERVEMRMQAQAEAKAKAEAEAVAQQTTEAPVAQQEAQTPTQEPTGAQEATDNGHVAQGQESEPVQAQA